MGNNLQQEMLQSNKKNEINESSKALIEIQQRDSKCVQIWVDPRQPDLISEVALVWEWSNHRFPEILLS